MKAKIITTSLLLSLLLILSGCAGVRYDPVGLGYFYGTPVYDGMGPGYWYPAYGYYGEYGGHLYGYYDTHPGHRGDSWNTYGPVPTGRRFKSHDFGNVRRHTGRLYMNREEGRKLYHSDRVRIASNRRDNNRSGNSGYNHRGRDRDHHGNHSR